MSDSPFESDFYAKIKFLDDNVKIVVKARDILEFENADEMELFDFDRSKIYTIPWHDGNKHINLAIQVSTIESISSRAEYEKFKNKRGVFPHLNDSAINRCYDSPSEEDSDVEYCEVETKKSHKTNKGKPKKTLPKKPDLDAQKKILDLKRQNFLTSNTMTLNNEVEEDESTSRSPSSLSSVSTRIVDKPRSIEESRLKLQIASMGCEIERLRTVNATYKHNISMLNDRLETVKNLNEVLQTEVFEYKKQLGIIVRIEEEKAALDAKSPLAWRIRMSTPNFPTQMSTNSLAACSSDLGVAAINVDSIDAGSDESYNDSRDTGVHLLEKDTDFFLEDQNEEHSRDENPRKRKLIYTSDQEEKMDNNAFVTDEDTLDSGLDNGKTESSQATLSSREFSSITNGLLGKRRKKDGSTKPQTTTNHEDSSASESQNDSYFRNFMHKETITSVDGVSVVYKWLNEDTKVLYDDLKECMRAKDMSKFVKSLLRLLHRDQAGEYEENLSKRCLSTTKPSFTADGTQPRVPLSSNEHKTINRCIKAYCSTKLNQKKYTEADIKNITDNKKNGYISEEINFCLKNQKRKLQPQ